MNKIINVIGGGLAGVEASLYLANHGYKVNLYEQKPIKMSPAHHSEGLGELVCSNSLKSKKLDNACGLLKEEMKYFSSIMMEASSFSEVPAGNALSVDRELFSEYITNKIKNHPNITLISEVSNIADGIEFKISGFSNVHSGVILITSSFEVNNEFKSVNVDDSLYHFNEKPSLNGYSLIKVAAVSSKT